MTTLVLIQGANPIPTWVAAEACLATWSEPALSRPERLPLPDRVIVLTSRQQQLPAARLKALLVSSGRLSDGAVTVVDRLADPNDDAQVTECVRALGRDDALHLSYAGGTKMMAVHAADGRPWASCSYLDAATHCLWIEGPRGGLAPVADAVGAHLPAGLRDGPAASVRGDLRLLLQPTVSEVLGLHGWMPVPAVEADQPALPEATALLARWLSDGQIRGFLNWRRVNRQPRWSRDPDATFFATLRPLDLARRPSDNLARALVRGLALDQRDPIAAETFVRTGDWNVLPYDPRAASPVLDRETVYRFLDGGWLERVVERWVHQWLENRLLAARQGLTIRLSAERTAPQVARNLTVRPAPSPTGVPDGALASTPTAEIDVLALVGHQLLALSCTTDGARASEKATEVWFRARQLGGDEARPAIVFLREAVSGLEHELANDFGGVNRVAVIGQSDLSPGVNETTRLQQTGRERFWDRLDAMVGWTRD